MPVARFQMPDGRIARYEVPEGTTPEQAQEMIQAQQQTEPTQPVQPPAQPEKPSYFSRYKQGVSQAGEALKQSFSDAPIKSTLTAIPGALEPAAAFVGNTIAGGAAVLHSALDKIPGSKRVGFDPNATFAQRRGEYEQGIGQYTNPQTRIGQNLTDAMGAVLKPVGDVVALPGKAAGEVAGFFGASPESQQSISDQTTAVANAALMARSMRPSQPQPKGQPVPTKAELKASSQQAYTNAKNAGATVTEQSFAQKMSNLTNYLKKEGLNKDLTPDTTAALKALSEHKGPLTIEQLDTYRKVAGAAQSKAFANKADARLAGKIVEAIDDYAETLGPKDIVGGNAKAAVDSLNEARGLWSRFRKTDAIDDLMQRAELRATQFSGSGLENAIRTEFRQLAMNKKKMRGFSQAEAAAIKKVASGGPVENALRILGKASPMGGIIPATLGSGAGLVAAGPLGAVAVPVAGAIARKGAEKMTMNNAARASEVMRRGPNNPMPAGQMPNVNPLLLGYNNQQTRPFVDFLRSPLEQR